MKYPLWYETKYKCFLSLSVATATHTHTANHAKQSWCVRACKREDRRSSTDNKVSTLWGWPHPHVCDWEGFILTAFLGLPLRFPPADAVAAAPFCNTQIHSKKVTWGAGGIPPKSIMWSELIRVKHNHRWVSCFPVEGRAGVRRIFGAHVCASLYFRRADLQPLEGGGEYTWADGQRAPSSLAEPNTGHSSTQNTWYTHHSSTQDTWSEILRQLVHTRAHTRTPVCVRKGGGSVVVMTTLDGKPCGVGRWGCVVITTALLSVHPHLTTHHRKLQWDRKCRGNACNAEVLQVILNKQFQVLLYKYSKPVH